MQRTSAIHHWRRGFTLVELLVATAILAVIMILVSQMIGDTSKLWKRTSAKVDAFRQARLGFELMTNELKAATTNTYFDYFDSVGRTVAEFNALGGTSPFLPAAYGRQSELHFISGTAATLKMQLLTSTPTYTPGGPYTHGVFFTWAGGYSASSTYATLNSLLNSTGFFIEYTTDKAGTNSYFSNGPPMSVLTNYPQIARFRLVQFIAPTENMLVYNYGLGLTGFTSPNSWFTQTTSTYLTPCTLTGHEQYCRIVANNVIALVVWPKKTDTIDDLYTGVTPADTTPLAPSYNYDSRDGIAYGNGAYYGNSHWQPGTTPQPLNLNQMPPILNVAMISLDEPSAVVLNSDYTMAPPKITTALSTGGAINSGKVPFQSTYPLYSGSQSVSNMDLDLLQVQANLAAITPHINFQVFKTTIAIRSAKFSK